MPLTLQQALSAPPPGYNCYSSWHIPFPKPPENGCILLAGLLSLVLFCFLLNRNHFMSPQCFKSSPWLPVVHIPAQSVWAVYLDPALSALWLIFDTLLVDLSVWSSNMPVSLLPQIFLTFSFLHPGPPFQSWDLEKDQIKALLFPLWVWTTRDII